MICPRCEQGDVRIVRLVAPDQVGFLCDECEALWFDRPTIGPAGFTDFGSWMRARGRPGLWSEVEVLPDDAPLDPPAGDAP